MSELDDDFLSRLKVDDAGVTFADSLGGEGGLPSGAPAAEAPALTTEQELEAARKQLARYKSLDAIADALERDPGKIYEVRDALDGKRREAGLTEHATPPPPKPQGPRTVLEAIQALPEADREKLNIMAQEKPAEYQAALADLSAKIQIQQFADASRPIVDASVQSSIRDFKLSKAGDPLYRHAEANFDREMADFDRTSFYQMPDGQRQRQLELRWMAAKAAAYDAAAAKSTPRGPRNVGGGGGAGGGSTSRVQAALASDDLKELAARSGLKPGQLEAIMREVSA